MIFKDRQQAGILLGEKLTAYKGKQVSVIGLARGGVVVAREVAHFFNFPLDVLVIKKLVSPLNREFAIGAIAPDNVAVIHWPSAHRSGADEAYLKTQNLQLSEEIKKKMLLYRKDRKLLEVRGKTVIMVDDGAATGATVAAAVKWLRQKKANKIIVAIPVAPPETVAKIKPEVDELVVLETPADFAAIGQFYQNFPQVEDEEVIKLLKL